MSTRSVIITEGCGWDFVQKKEKIGSVMGQAYDAVDVLSPTTDMDTTFLHVSSIKC